MGHAYNFRDDPRSARVTMEDGKMRKVHAGGRPKSHITAAKRKSLPKTSFGLPGSRKYPVDTVKRARNAPARAAQQVKKGNLSASSAAHIKAKAHAALRRMQGHAPKD